MSLSLSGRLNLSKREYERTQVDEAIIYIKANELTRELRKLFMSFPIDKQISELSKPNVDSERVELITKLTTIPGVSYSIAESACTQLSEFAVRRRKELGISLTA